MHLPLTLPAFSWRTFTVIRQAALSGCVCVPLCSESRKEKNTSLCVFFSAAPCHLPLSTVHSIIPLYSLWCERLFEVVMAVHSASVSSENKSLPALEYSSTARFVMEILISASVLRQSESHCTLTISPWLGITCTEAKPFVQMFQQHPARQQTIRLWEAQLLVSVCTDNKWPSSWIYWKTKFPLWVFFFFFQQSCWSVFFPYTICM